jgi:TRAP-type C4-dicarboxylate transport system permease small subunit
MTARMEATLAEAPVALWTRRLAVLPKVLVGGLLILAILDMLAGVFLRYVVVEITDYFDWPSVSFFWVEELGEFALAWLTLVGAAIGVVERTHFALGVLAYRFPPRLRRAVGVTSHALIAAFGALAAVFGWRLAALNSVLTSPGLGINLGWLYFASVVGGTLIAVYALAMLTLILGRRVAPVPGPEGH